MTFLCFSLWLFVFSSITGSSLQHFTHSSRQHPTVEHIRAAGFPAEEHHTHTADGYLIVLHRIPPPRPTPRVVVYFHGLFSSSLDLVLRGRDNGLGFSLAEAGFDVWLPNLRGTTEDPVVINATRSNYWDFSWDENAKYDFPAIMDYVLSTTGVEKVSTVGMSMAGNVVLGGLIYHPRYNQRLRLMLFFAPTVRMRHTTATLRMAGPHWRLVQKLFQAFRIDWLPFVNIDLFHEFMSKLCSVRDVGAFLCASVLFSVENIIFSVEKSLLPKIFQYYPHPGSSKTVIHYFQMMDSGRFCAFDHGREENLRRYRQPSPPDYDLSRVTAPAAIFYSKWDTLVNYKDAEWLAAQLRNNTVHTYSVPKPNFAHLSFVYDPDIKNLVHNRVISLLLYS